MPYAFGASSSSLKRAKWNLTPCSAGLRQVVHRRVEKIRHIFKQSWKDVFTCVGEHLVSTMRFPTPPSIPKATLTLAFPNEFAAQRHPPDTAHSRSF